MLDFLGCPNLAGWLFPCLVFDCSEIRMLISLVSCGVFLSLRLKIDIGLFRTVRRPYCSLKGYLSMF